MPLYNEHILQKLELAVKTEECRSLLNDQKPDSLGFKVKSPALDQEVQSKKKLPTPLDAGTEQAFRTLSDINGITVNPLNHNDRKRAINLDHPGPRYMALGFGTIDNTNVSQISEQVYALYICSYAVILVLKPITFS